MLSHLEGSPSLLSFLSFRGDWIDRKKKFVLLFLGIALPLYLAYFKFYYLIKGMPVFGIYSIAKSFGFLLKLIGVNNIVEGAFVTFFNSTFEIIGECTGILEAILLVSFVFAYPSSLKQKVIGSLGGIVLLYLINMFRLLLLAFISIKFPTYLDIIHVYFWQVSLIIIVLALWIAWIDLVVKNERMA